MINLLRTFCAVLVVLSVANMCMSTSLGLRNTYERDNVPRFEDFPVTEKFAGKPAPVKLLTAEARRYRMVIREGAREGPNFAGHFTIVTWGCGAGCVQFAIVDARTGLVYSPRFYVAARTHFDEETDQPDEPLQFRIDSKLLIVSGSPNEKNDGMYYYSWDGKRLALIKSAVFKKN